MADILRKTLDGTWTNIPEPYKPPVAGADPNTPVEENGQLMQTLPDGRKIAIGTAHNTPGPNQADPIIAGAEQTLHDVQPEADTLAAATPDLAGARSVKQQHPGAYDDLSDAELQAKLDAAGHAGDHGYQPGLNTSPLHASLEGFLSGAAEGATSPSGKAAIGGASALLGPAGVPVAAGAEALAQALGVHYGNENAPASFPEAAGNVGEAAAAPAISAATTAAAPIVARELAKVPKAVTGLGGAAIGGYTGYKRGGIPGAVEGALAGGAMGAAVPKSLQALQKLTGLGAEAEAGAPFPRAVRTMGGTQVPEKSVEDVLEPLGGRTADRRAGLSEAMVEKLNGSKAGLKRAAQPDLFQQATAEQPAHAFDWPEAGGRMEPDANGSHHLTGWSPTNLPGPESIAHQPLGPEDIPAFSFQGEAMAPGAPPAVGGTDLAGGGGTPRVSTPLTSKEMDPIAEARLRAVTSSEPYKQWLLKNPGFRTNHVGAR